MSRLNVFVDGSWLFKACAPERALSYRLEYPDKLFALDQSRLLNSLLAHAQNHIPECNNLGDLFFSTSIFELPEHIDDWPNEHEDVTLADVDTVKRSTLARERFTTNALQAGYSDKAIFRPKLKGWMLSKLRERRFQEKQVDATVVALLVKYAITNPEDVHVIITGDSDILPAIRVAYPEYSKNVFVATTHPDQLKAESRQTSFALADFDYSIPPFYLEENAQNLLQGDNVYLCVHCNKVFARPRAIPRNGRACCHPCHQTRS
ncbi:NYN domain-containing protein [Pseudomonas sp. zfem002]|uniref:NYN domain-containing protein n=1 Tax=Pseudomonas sp. zfem002 TaxID=3078197 RepID=UPI0029278EDF|nr:NYN domain-containing protein [Pseudomonas sp. zfem002]MDU9389292.1 NYN domain-containing protein [Pseudomonas sp. zfem002]